MKKLDIVHHKFLMTVLVVIVFVVGVFFGVRLSSTAGEEAMRVLLFALLFLNTVVLYVVFTQILHVRDDIEKSGRKNK